MLSMTGTYKVIDVGAGTDVLQKYMTDDHEDLSVRSSWREEDGWIVWLGSPCV